MKKLVTTFIVFAAVALSVPLFAGKASAQTGYYDPYYGGSRQSVYDRHRQAVNITAATGAGAVIGALFGGKKGALIGAAGGAVAGAIITKAQRPRNYSSYGYYTNNNNNYNYGRSYSTSNVYRRSRRY